jgi:LPS O-antigen subunit length determinant protein (WzzB/FepE family)
MNNIEYNQERYIEEDEIDLRELFSTIWANKWKLIFISLLITSFAVIYAITKPNSYTSKTILIMKEQSKPSIGGSAAALAAMAGVSLGGGSGLDVASLFKQLISDYAFNKYVINKYNLLNKLSEENIDKNMVYILNGREMSKDIKDFLSSKKEQTSISKEDLIFNTYKKIKDIISTSTDKESGAITLSATLEDRFLAKDLVNIYLKEMSEYIKRLDLKEINEQEAYYNSELDEADSIELRKNLADLLSALTKKKVLSQAGEFYMVKQLTKAEVPYIKDKTKPKRALIVIVAFITSIIIGIFMIFFGQFLKNTEEEPVKLEVKKEDKEKEEISF